MQNLAETGIFSEMTDCDEYLKEYKRLSDRVTTKAEVEFVIPLYEPEGRAMRNEEPEFDVLSLSHFQTPIFDKWVREGQQNYVTRDILKIMCCLWMYLRKNCSGLSINS